MSKYSSLFILAVPISFFLGAFLGLYVFSEDIRNTNAELMQDFVYVVESIREVSTEYVYLIEEMCFLEVELAKEQTKNKILSGEI